MLKNPVDSVKISFKECRSFRRNNQLESQENTKRKSVSHPESNIPQWTKCIVVDSTLRRTTLPDLPPILVFLGTGTAAQIFSLKYVIF